MERVISIVHLTQFFDDTLCGIKDASKEILTYELRKVTCADCLNKAREEAIENQNALATLPHCPHCGGMIETVTLTFTVTKAFRLDVMTERDFETKEIKPIIYGTDYDTLDTELVPDKEWQVVCENGHEFFTKRLEQIESGAQWFVKEGVEDEVDKTSICPVCGNDRSEHDWEVHTAEAMRPRGWNE